MDRTGQTGSQDQADPQIGTQNTIAPPQVLIRFTNHARAVYRLTKKLTRIIHDSSSRNRAVALRDGHAEP